MKKTIALILCVILCLSVLAGCGKKAPAEESGTPDTSAPSQSESPAGPTVSQSFAQAPASDAEVKYADTVEYVVGNDTFTTINFFNPASSVSPTNYIGTCVFDRLIERDFANEDYFMSLATSYDTTDYQTYVFKLRDDVQFHNGEKFTSDDVIFTIEQAKANPGTPGAGQWAAVETATAIDEYTVELVLDDVNVNFLYSITVAAASIQNREAVMADPDKGPMVGTGPFEVVEFFSGDMIRLKRSATYWNTEKTIATENLIFRHIPEAATRAVRIQNGETQMSMGVSTEDMGMFTSDPDNYVVYPYTVNQPYGISFNMNDKITGDYNFRMAVAHAIDKTEIAVFCSGEWAKPDTEHGTVYGYGTEFRNNDIPAIQRDIEKAKEYLANSTYNGEEMEIAASISTNVMASQVVAQQLEEIGVKMRVEVMDSAGLNAHMFDPNGTSQMVFHGINSFNMSAGSFRNAFYPGGSTNRMFYNNPELNAMIDEAGTILDTDARRAHYMKMQEMVNEDLPFINVFYRVQGMVATKGLGGLVLEPDNLQMDIREVFLILE